VLSVTLSLVVLALGILGPIEREAVAHQPIGKVNAVNGTQSIGRLFSNGAKVTLRSVIPRPKFDFPVHVFL
jgi:hypothetical protein